MQQQQPQQAGDQVSTTDWSEENDGDLESDAPSESEAEMNTIITAPQATPRVRHPQSILRPVVPQPQGNPPQVTLPTISPFGPAIAISQYPAGMGPQSHNL